MKDKAEEFLKEHGMDMETNSSHVYSITLAEWKQLIQSYHDQQSKEEAKESKWIILKKPPPARCLLLTTSKMVVVGDRYKGIWRIDGATRWVSRDSSNGRYVNRYRVLVSNYNDGDITHWMPLPDPPR